MIVPRTCTEIWHEDKRMRRKTPQCLEKFRDVPAYVLLGDPGSGKTTAFKSECEALKDGACLITARKLRKRDIDQHPEWRNKTLFIDGLDEIRASTSDAITPFDEILAQLENLRPPKIRLSCRATDWLGVNDQKHLEDVVPGGKVRVLLLDNLSNADIEKILVSSEDANINIQDFIEEAKRQGIEELLGNPLTLNMLAKTIAPDGDWPKGRLEIFEQACSQMAQEHNEEHSLGKTPQAPSDLLNTAGHLSAIQLISGISGYAQHANQATTDCPAFNKCGGDARQVEQVVKTKLFTHHGDCVTPIHRHLAEFVGARYLARTISNGLPARRVLSLMTGWDGIVVTEFRGLSAWLATQSTEARTDLIGRDPVGVGLYGDITGFSAEDKHDLLKSLSLSTNLRNETRWDQSAFGSLASPDMEPEIRNILASPRRDKEHQELTGFVLGFLPHGQTLPGLCEILSGMIRDHTRWPYINTRALDAFIHCAGPNNFADALRALLTDIRQGMVSDPDYELLGTLLTELYPESLSPSEVFGYLSTGGNGNLVGRYALFWETDLCDKSSDDQVADLLDHLTERFSELRPALEHHDLRSIPAKLLAHRLQANGDSLDAERLYDWLGVGPVFSSWDVEPFDFIRSWLEQHPDIQKAVIREGLKRHSNSDVHEIYLDFNERLYGSEVPRDFGIWCLNETGAMAAAGSPAEQYLLEQAILAQKKQVGSEGLSLAVLEEHAKTNETLQKIMAPPPTSERAPYRPKLKGRNQTEDKLLIHLRSSEPELRENRADPDLLFHMARVYFGHFIRREGGEGAEAIKKRLQGDSDLTSSVLWGLRHTVDRQDVPGNDEILDLRKEGKISFFSLPFLAALAEIEKTEPENWAQWGDERIHKALLFYYTTPHGDYRPLWYEHLLKGRPEAVADAQIRFAISEFQEDREHIYKLWELAHDKAHSQVARLACLPLLRAFPARCKKRQLKTLEYLLWAAIQYAERNSLLELIGKKTSQTSTSIGQRVYWLAAGMIVSPEKYCNPLQGFALGRQNRIGHLAEFLRLDDRLATKFDGLPVPASKIVVRLVGSYASPGLMFMESNGSVTPRMEASDLVHKQIRHLAASATPDASEALGELLGDPALSLWHDILRQAAEDQQIIRRDAEYHRLSIEQICQTLSGGTPAGASDLWALLMDWLREIGVQHSRGNANGWRQYWNEDEYGRPTTPKHENSCRDAILGSLDERFSQSVDLQPEGQYNRNKHADIRASYQDFNVPIEIKKNNHPDLWSSIKNQLIRKYAIDPGTDGYGIYLVLWFGKSRMQQPPSGPCPADPESLRKQLSATLSNSEARKISVCVINVSKEDPHASDSEH